jgi:hypothetical protein
LTLIEVKAMRTRVTQLGLGSLMMVVLGMLASPVPRASAGACATIRHFETSFAAAAGTTLPADGGVLFAPTLASGRPDAAAGPNDPPRESLRRGTRALPSTRIELAPGWVVLRPRARTTGAIRAMAGSSERDFTMARASTEPLAPPSGPRLRFYPSRQVQGGPRGPSTAAAYNTLTISAPAPAGTFGIVVRNAPAAGRPAAADGFAVPLDAPDQVSFSFNNAGGRCQPGRPGELVQQGASVEVLFVDAQGRVSEAVAATVQ